MCARDLNEAQISDIRDHASAIGIEKHHLHICPDSRGSHSMCSSVTLTFLAQNRKHCIGRFLGADRLHAAEINWAFAEKTGATFDMMSKDNVAVAERPGQARLSGTKNSDYGHAEQSGQMHCAGIVREQ